MSDFLTSGRRKDEDFGETALTYLKELAKKDVLGVEKGFSSKYTDKGIICEDNTIALLNNVYFKSYVKNEIRKTDYGMSGCCDIVSKSENLIRDVKTSWSIDTFPFFADDCEKMIKKSGYEAQLRAYMMLYDIDNACIDFGLVNTPPDLIGYEDAELHEVEHLPEKARITTSQTFKRCKEWEANFIERHAKAQVIYSQFCKELESKLQ